MDNYRLKLSGDGTADIAAQVSEISWRDSVDTLGMELSFERLASDEPGFPKTKISVGDKLALFNGSAEVFRGIITDQSFDGRFGQSFTALDYAFYLNQSEVVVQFNGIRADEAIKQLCQRYSVPVGVIVSITTTVKKIYKDQTVAAVIRDILAMAEGELATKYRLEMRQGRLCIERYSDLIVRATYQAASNLPSFDAMRSMSLTGSRSIIDMRNSIVIVSSDEQSVSLQAQASDSASIAKYGLLQAVEMVDEANIAQARNIAKNRLAELGRIVESYTVELLGSDNVRAGRLLYISEPLNGVEGYYLVKTCTHTWANGIHLMQCEMGVG